MEIVFPIVGHYFLPPDRVFELIEKKIKNINIIMAKMNMKKSSKATQQLKIWAQIGKHSTGMKRRRN